MRAIYVDAKGVCNTNAPIEEGEIVSVNIADKLNFKVVGVRHEEAPCSGCSLYTARFMGIIPRCPRMQPDGWDPSDNYDLYDYVCGSISPIKISDAMEEL